MKMLAHLTNTDGRRIEQTLKEHCVKTASYASDALKNIGFEKTAYLAGLLHDKGKGNEIYANYLERAFRGEDVVRGSVNHTFTPLIYLLERYHKREKPMELLSSELIAYAVGSHHGLFDCVDFNERNGFIYRLNKDKDEICYEESCENFFCSVASEAEIDELFHGAVQEIQEFYLNVKAEYGKAPKKLFFHLGLLARMLTSAVIYGDRRDTREFMEQREGSMQAEPDWQRQLDYMSEKLDKFDSTTRMNQVRSDISSQCLSFAAKPEGIYRLNVPTGAGKTLAALRYALAHARQYSKKKLIFITPLLSILDQNARVIRDYMADPELVLEHHSNVVYEQQNEELDSYEILTESWEAPVMISTLVQLLNILFAHQTSTIARMRALCDSVIVIDEVQSLPEKTAEMFSMAMNFLSKYCHTTIVLSSATQPCFENLEYALELGKEPDMVKLNPEQLMAFQRAEIINCVTDYGMDLDECAEFCTARMEDSSSQLVICNTKTEAIMLYLKMQRIAEAQGWKIFHLSTSMCQRHRLDTLDSIQRELKALQAGLKEHKEVTKIICISTQVVEAGIDFSWEVVVRVIAGIDNLAQAAGRCNRSNEYDHPGKVYLIKLKNEHLSGLEEIYEAQKSTLRVLEELENDAEESLIGQKAADRFYQYFFASMKSKLKYPIEDEYRNQLYLADLLANENPFAKDKKSRQTLLMQPFKTAAQKFTVFDSNTIDVLVPFQEGKHIIDKLRKLDGKKKFCLKEMDAILKEAKLYTISIFETQKKQLDQYGYLEQLLDGRVLVLNEHAYHDEYGLKRMQEPGVEEFIF